MLLLYKDGFHFTVIDLKVGKPVGRLTLRINQTHPQK